MLLEVHFKMQFLGSTGLLNYWFSKLFTENVLKRVARGIVELQIPQNSRYKNLKIEEPLYDFSRQTFY